MTGLPELAAGPGQALSRTGLIGQLRQASTLDEISNIADRPLRRAGAAPDEDVVLAATEVFDSRFRPTNAEVNAAVSNELAILRVVNAREVKRFVNLFRFYAVIGVRRRLQGYESATIREAATLAALAARWPNVVGLAGEPSVLTALSNKPPSGGQAPDSRLGDIKPQRLAALATFLSAPEHALSAGALSLLVG